MSGKSPRPKGKVIARSGAPKQSAFQIRRRDCFAGRRSSRSDSFGAITNKIGGMKMKTIIALLMCTCLAIAQDAKQTYEIPFPEGTSASKGNVIELSVANSSTLTAEEVKVEVTKAPDGIKFTEKTVTLTALKSKEEQTASFSFSVEKTAQINKEQTLSFRITDKTGQEWMKEIKVKITPPTTYELFQNYPNPFGEAIETV
jgi:hypothetical protein